MGLILGLLGRLKNHMEPIVIVVITVVGTTLFMQSFVTLAERVADKWGPSAFNQTLEAKILDAEKRSRSYVDEKTEHGEAIVEIKHQEVLRSLSTLTNAIQGLGTRIDQMHRDIASRRVTGYAIHSEPKEERVH
jgi:hypothetical protein